MALKVRYVGNLADIVEPVAEWVCRAPAGQPIFHTEHLLLPTNGAKAWLMPELAKRVGTRPGMTDGVVANVQVGYLGSLNKFVVPQRYRDFDPWSIETMTAAILGIIAGDPVYEPMIHRAGGALSAAARLADRFDRYHARRPMMIRAWEKGSPVMAPTTADSFNDGEWRAGDLGDQRWQFDLWRALRDVIGVAPWPVQVEVAVQQLRRGENVVGVPSRLMVAGMQSLSLGAVELLEAFGHVSDVDVLLVHPSPTLADRWASELVGTEVPRGALQIRPTDEELPDNVHTMVHSWLRGSRELQQMLASQGLDVSPHGSASKVEPSTLLGRVQAAVAGNGQAERAPRVSDDLSLQVHRCYNLTRQVEVLHDALLHAFRDLDNLAPHEVVIVSPRLAEAAPILEAVFDRTVTVAANGVETELRIPLAVAERQLRFVSEGAEFLGNLLALMTGRFDVSAFLSVATSPLVTEHLGVDGEVVSTWQRQIERTRVRWGLSADQRTAAGLATKADSVHTWRAAIERSILGAALPDAAAAEELGGVVPLDDIGVDDIDALSRLVQVFDAIEALELASRGGVVRHVANWCDDIERAVIALCGNGDRVAGAFELLDDLASSTIVPGSDGSSRQLGAPVSFADVATHLTGQISGVPGHQPLRTGAVTATSLMPLRGVPYRVVCLLGIDDGAFGGGELESDDLIGRQIFIGDDDPRVDSRRQLLDAVLAAGEQVIITCDGRSIQNNAVIPLTTALAEFVDFARRHGAGERSDNAGSDIEFLHPRHATSARNFALGGIVPNRVWSHSLGVREVAGKVGVDKPTLASVAANLAVRTANVVDLDALGTFVKSPLEMFVREILGISTWKDDHAPDEAIIPFAVDSRTQREFVGSYLAGKAGGHPDWTPEMHIHLARLNGDVPIGAYGDAELVAMQTLAESFLTACQTHGVLPIVPDPKPVLVTLDSGLVVRGNIPHLQAAQQMIGVVRYSPYYDRDHAELGLRLLAATAAELSVRHGITIHQHNDKKKADQAQSRLIYLGDTVDAAEASRRLGELVELRAVASVAPMPSFGDTVDAIFDDPDVPDFDKGRLRFDRFIGSDDFAKSLERRIYGNEPDFAAIFDSQGPVVDFWSRFHGVFHFTRGKANGIPGKLPHGNSHWGVL
jgi:exodeoxyribonuclease V gamma subunit